MAIIKQYDLTRYDKAAATPTWENPEPAVIQKPVYEFTVCEVKQGDTGKSVALMQKCLRGLGYPRGHQIALDAVAGNATIYALKEFQRAAGLEVDGICGEKSWKILLDI